jgi:hypothetical protein
MSLLGKILAVLNLLAALVLIPLAAMDYGKRQSFAYAVTVSRTVLDGLPVTEQEKDLEGNVRANLLSAATRQELFAGLRTQEEAVREVKRVTDGLVNASQDKAAQAAAYARVLLPLARSNAEREQLLGVQGWLADGKARDQLKADLLKASRDAADPNREPKAPFAQAFRQALRAQPGSPYTPFDEAYLKAAGDPPKPFDQSFEAALDDVRTRLQADYERAFQAADGKYTAADGAAKPLSPDEQRAAIAHVLFSLADVVGEAGGGSPAEQYKRAQAAAGLEATVREVNDQARVAGDIVREANAEAGREREAFAAAHRQLVAQLQDRALQVEAKRGVLERVKADAAAQEALVKGRERDLAQARQQLADLRQQTAERLQELRAMSDALYQVRLEVRRISDDNRRREQEIRKLEQGR